MAALLQLQFFTKDKVLLSSHRLMAWGDETTELDVPVAGLQPVTLKVRQLNVNEESRPVAAPVSEPLASTAACADCGCAAGYHYEFITRDSFGVSGGCLICHDKDSSSNCNDGFVQEVRTTTPYRIPRA